MAPPAPPPLSPSSSRARGVRAALSWFRRLTGGRALRDYRAQGERGGPMFLISVEWLDEAKTRARFNLPGRDEWRAEHIDALMHALAEIREEMRPAVTDEPPRLQEVEPLHDPRYA